MNIDENALWVYGRRVGIDAFIIRIPEMCILEDTCATEPLAELVVQTPRDLTLMKCVRYKKHIRHFSERLADTHIKVTFSYASKETEETHTHHPLRMWPMAGI